MFVTLGSHHAMRMRHIVICGLSGSTIFFTISHTRYDFRKKNYWTWNVCFDFLYNSVWNMFHSKKKRMRYDQKCRYIVLQVKYSLFLSDFDETWIISTDLRKSFKYEISWKSVQWKPSCSMRTDRRTEWTDMTNLAVPFCSSENTPKSWLL